MSAPPLAEALERARPLALRRALRLLDGDQAAAEELVADVLARLWERGREADEAYSVAYVVACVNNAVTTRWRSAARRAARTRLVALPAAHPPGDDSSLDRIEVDRLLGLLSPRAREVVALRYLAGLSQAEVAARVGIPQGTVASTAARALSRLREVAA